MNRNHPSGREVFEFGVEDVDGRIVHLGFAAEPFDLARQGDLGAFGKLLDAKCLVEEHDRENRRPVGHPHLHDQHLGAGSAGADRLDPSDDRHFLTDGSQGDRLDPRPVQISTRHMQQKVGDRTDA